MLCQLMDVAIGIAGVDYGNCLIEATEGGGAVAHVAIGAPQYIVGQHTLVGCSLAVEVAGEQEAQAVGGKEGVGLVLRIAAEQQMLHLQGLGHAGCQGVHAAEHAEGRVGICPHERVGYCELPLKFLLLLLAAAQRHQSEQENEDSC